MKKEDFRKQQIKKIQDFAKNSQKSEEDKKLFKLLLADQWFVEAQNIGVTSSLDYEVDTSDLIALLWEAGKNVWLARSNSDKTMDFVKYNYNTKLVNSKYGIAEVADSNAEINNDLDLLIVPGIAFSLEDHARLGFGGGYYDRFLAKHNVHTISLANSAMVYSKAEWPVENHDIFIDKILTTEE